MSFQSLKLPTDLITGYQDPNTDFFSPVLSCSCQFDVAVGYFTSGWLKDVLKGMHQLAINGGRCRFIVSPHLNYKDLEVLKKSSKLDNDDLNYVEQKLFEQFVQLNPDQREILSDLITVGICDFKIATSKGSDANLFHAKIGIALDHQDEMLAFNGSFNFTANAKSNWEYISVYREDSSRDKDRIENIKNRFECLWKNEDIFYDVKTASNALKLMIKKYSYNKNNYPRIEVNPQINLRDYQKKAIKSWAKNKGKGMFVMATGTGKTITALSVVKEVVTRFDNKPIFIVFVLPLKHLLDQWHAEANQFGFDAIKCYETSVVWRESLNEKLSYQAINKSGTVIAMVTNATFASKNFQKIVNGIEMPFMIIADEAHNLGSPKYLQSLPMHADYRLGLTATPERYNDPEGTEALIQYFDKTVFEFSLEDAIQAGYLVKYNYYPFKCEFNPEEFFEYKKIIEKLESNQLSLIEMEAKLESITSGATNKLVILRKELEKLIKNKSLKHTLVYCGSYRDEEGSRQIEKVLKILGNELSIKASKFTAEESVSDRIEILEQFTSAELEVVVAIKCLDEGVDIPSTKNAFILSSTSNPREFIQRRGRVLRLCSKTNKQYANIYDFIMIPPAGEFNSHLVTKEVKRGLEYNSLAQNANENLEMFQELISNHNVDLGK